MLLLYIIQSICSRYNKSTKQNAHITFNLNILKYISKTLEKCRKVNARVAQLTKTCRPFGLSPRWPHTCWICWTHAYGLILHSVISTYLDKWMGHAVHRTRIMPQIQFTTRVYNICTWYRLLAMYIIYIYLIYIGLMEMRRSESCEFKSIVIINLVNTWQSFHFLHCYL